MALNRRHLDLAFLGALLLLAALVVRGWMKEGEALPQESPSRHADAAAVPPLKKLDVASRAASGTPVDLLARVDPAADAVAGHWTSDGRSLRSPAAKWARLRLPSRAPAEYELRLRCARVGGGDALILGLGIDGVIAQVVLDGNGGRGSWIEVQGGTHGIGPNGVTYFQGPVFANGRPAEVVVSARPGGLAVRVDGFTVLSWRGPKDRLYTAEGWTFPDPRAFYVGAWESVFVFDRIEVASPSGAVELLR